MNFVCKCSMLCYLGTIYYSYALHSTHRKPLFLNSNILRVFWLFNLITLFLRYGSAFVRRKILLLQGTEVVRFS